MYSSLLFFCFSSLLCLVGAIPSFEYYLRTSKGLYVATWHTSAGRADAVLTNGTENAIKGYISNSQQLFDFGPELIWGMKMAADPKNSGMKKAHQFPSLN